MAVESRLAVLPGLIDHTLLRPEAGLSEIKQLCAEARQYQFHAVCVNPIWVSVVRVALRGSEIRVVSVAGFPLGATRTDIKVAETCAAADEGADEIDMVGMIGLLRDKRLSEFEADIRKVRRNLPASVELKVIIEANLLTPSAIEAGIDCAVNAGAQFVKSGTGFFGPCTVEQISHLVRSSGGRIKVKASGGIRTLEGCRQMLAAGADRIGTSASIAIMKEWGELHQTSL
jgi:deoxyribose-phosphate aldolase